MIIVLTFILNAGLNFLLGLAIAAVLGPSQYGRFAVASMVAIVLATAAFDWLRLSATRSYTEATRTADPSLRATLEVAYAGLAVLILLVTAGLVALRVDVGFSSALLVAAVAAAIANARFDFTTALARARFLERTHAILMVGKNVAAFGLAIAAAYWFKDAVAVMAALAVSALAAILPGHRVLRDAKAVMRQSRPAHLVGFARYGVPIVAANVIYQLIVLANRSAAAAHLGYAEAGQLSLPTDMSIRLLLAIGAALDVYLFQLVIRCDAVEGRVAAQAQIVRNLIIVTAILMLLAVGYACAMPAFETVVVPLKYRGTFGSVSLILVPGILAFCLVNFALNPVFQLEHRTGPVVWTALAALGVDVAGLVIVPSAWGLYGYAIVHSVSLLAGFVCTLGLAMRLGTIRWPVRDLGGIAVAAIAAALAIWPTRSLPQPLLALGGAAIFGTLAYMVVLYGFDVGGFRALAKAGFRRFAGAKRPFRHAETRA